MRVFFLVSMAIGFSVSFVRQCHQRDSFDENRAVEVNDKQRKLIVSTRLSPEVPVPNEWKKLQTLFGESFRGMYVSVSNIDDPLRRSSLLSAIILEWVTVNPEDALEFVQSRKDASEIERVLRAWLRSDPTTAVAAIKRNKETLSGSIGSLMEELGRGSGAQLIEMAGLVVPASPFDTRIQDAFARAARHDLDDLRAQVMEMAGNGKMEALAGVAEAWAERDEAAVFQWIENFESSAERSSALRGLLKGLAKANPIAAMEALHLAPPAESSDSRYLGTRTGEVVLREAAGKDFDATLNWLALHPDSIDPQSAVFGLSEAVRERISSDFAGTLSMARDHEAGTYVQKALEGILVNSGGSLNKELWSWLDGEPQTEFALSLEQIAIGQAVATSPEVALERAAKLLDDGKISAIPYKLLAKSIINDLDDFEEAGWLLDSAPVGFKESVLTDLLRNEVASGGDAKEFTEWLPQISQQQRDEIVKTKAASLASFAPTTALEWSHQLDPSDQAIAMHSLVETWAKANSYEASEWIASLPEGGERDAAALALVEVISSSEPDSAWEWAEAISAPDQRQAALRKVLKQLGSVAADTLENSGLEQSEKDQLRTWIGGE